MSAFAAAAVLALLLFAAALGCMVAFCFAVLSRVAGGDRHLAWAGGLAVAGVAVGALANLL